MTPGASWILWRATTTPNAVALECADGERIRWSTLAGRARRVAGGLAAHGVRRGEIVGALVGNHPDFAALLHAAHLLGATLLPLNVRHSPAELAFAVADAGARLVVHPGGRLGDTAVAMAAEAAVPATADAMAAEAAGPATAGAMAAEAAVPATADLADLTAARPLGVPPADAPGTLPLALLYTSGTTGKPKGALLSRSAFFWSALASAAHLGAPSGERWLACMPLYHVGGIAILVRATLFGATVVLHDRFDPERVSRAFDADAISIASLVPTMLRRVLQVRGDAPAPAALRAILTGGAAAPLPLLEEARARGLPALPTYGLTEACSQVATLPVGVSARRDCAGVPLLGTRLAIRDDAGTDLPPGEPGEICVHGPTLMNGYHRRPQETARALRDGWLHTGDVGTLDEDGFLRVLDRRADLVVSGGENVYPAEVEAALELLPGIAEVAVGGEPDADLGQRVVAWIVPGGGAPPDLESVRAAARARLADYKLPRALRLVDSLPRTASGKLRRAALRSPPS